MLYSIIVTLIVIICVLLTIVVLLQPGQGQGLSGGLAAMSGQAGPNMGARRTADLLSKSTAILGGAFLVLCVLANFAIDSGDAVESAVQQSGVNAPVNQDFDINNPAETPSAIPDQSSQESEGGGSATGSEETGDGSE